MPVMEKAFYSCSVARVRLDFKSAPQHSGTFLHILQAVAMTVNRRAIESDSIVFHHQTDAAIMQMEREIDRVSGCVPKYVARGFPGNGEHLRSLLRSQPLCGFGLHV